MDRLLLITDSPLVSTGFGTVSKQLLPRLSEFVSQIDQLAIYQFGDSEVETSHAVLHPVGSSDTMGLDVLDRISRPAPDIVLIVHELIYCGVWAGRLRTGGYRGPIVGYFPIYGPRLTRREETALRLMDARISYTEYGRNVVEHMGYMCSAIHLGVDHDVFFPPSPELREKLIRDAGWEDRFVISYVARNRWNKQQPKLMRVARRLVDGGIRNLCVYMHCVPKPVSAHWIPGMGKLQQEWDLESLREELSLENVVSFPMEMTDQRSGITAQSLAQKLQAASCTAHVAHGEGFGLPLVEAMACGLPVACTADGRAMEELVGAAGILVDGEDELEDAAGNRFKDIHEDSWTQALLSLHGLQSDDRAWNLLRGRSIERSRLFSWDATARSLHGRLGTLSRRQSEPWQVG